MKARHPLTSPRPRVQPHLTEGRQRLIGAHWGVTGKNAASEEGGSAPALLQPFIS